MHWYEWAFSGTGAAVIALVGNLSFRRRSSQGTEFRRSPIQTESPGSVLTTGPIGGATLTGPATSSQVAAGENITQSHEVHNHYTHADDNWKITEPAAKEFIDEVGQALPFEQQDAGKRYKGLRVVWEARLYSIESDRGKHLITAVDRDSKMMMFAITNMPPEIKTATRNSILGVKGKVEFVWSSGVHLQDDPEVRLIRRA